MVGLRAQREAAHHLGQQRVDAPAQVGRAKRQPDDVDANHRPNSRSSEASSRVCASGQCRSSRVPPTFNSTRTDVDAAPGATRAATKPLGLAAGEGSGLTPSSRACQRRACAHQLCSVPAGTPLASAHTCAFWPEARYAATCSRHRSICCRSMSTSSRSLIAKTRGSQLQR
uniref:Transposase n=1 Tax=Delftia sp. AN3 TaxID=173681 RepID=Q0GQU7_9BURK|nr:transposase [Delftia sp. AN3]